MKHLLLVSNSDSTNLYGYKFSVGALVHFTHDSCLLGVPSFISHDNSRPIGWNFPQSIYFEPGLTRAVSDCYLPESDDDQKWLVNRHEAHYHLTFIEPNLEYFKELQQILGSYLNGTQKLVAEEGVALFQTNIAVSAFPKLFEQRDKDGLIPLSALTPVGAGVYREGDLLIYAHQYFRRSLFRLNSLNYPFLGNFQSLNPQEFDKRIAIDPDLIGLAKTYKGDQLELQYWWGPKFKDDLNSIPVGVTHHEADEIDKLFFGVSSTEFRWGIQNEVRVFEAEELRDLPKKDLDAPEEYGCRYVHATVDLDSGKVLHADGAIRSYSVERYEQRKQLDLSRAGRDTSYTKLWRVDGNVDVNVWKGLISNYYRDNTLVGEYLGADEESLRQKKLHATRRPKDEEQSFINYTMASDQGLRIALCFCADSQYKASDSLRVVSQDNFTYGDQSGKFVESAVLEVKKTLGKENIHLEISQNTRFVTFKDRYLNLPLIIFPSTNSQELRKAFNKALSTVFKALQTSMPDMVICYKYGIAIDEERIAIVSILGAVDQVVNWLSLAISEIRTTYKAIHEWSEEITNYLASFSATIDNPSLFTILKSTGVFYIDRSPVHIGKFGVSYSEESRRHEYGLEFTQDEKEMVQRQFAKNVVFSIGFLILASRCSRCGADYEKCGCSSLIEKDVYKEIVNAYPFAFWTDKPTFQFQMET